MAARPFVAFTLGQRFLRPNRAQPTLATAAETASENRGHEEREFPNSSRARILAGSQPPFPLAPPAEWCPHGLFTHGISGLDEQYIRRVRPVRHACSGKKKQEPPPVIQASSIPVQPFSWGGRMAGCQPETPFGIDGFRPWKVKSALTLSDASSRVVHEVLSAERQESFLVRLSLTNKEQSDLIARFHSLGSCFAVGSFLSLLSDKKLSR